LIHKTATNSPAANRIPSYLVIFITAAALAGAFLFVSCEHGQKMVTLKFKYEPGQKLVYDLTQKSNTKVIEGDSTVKSGTHEISMVITEFVRRMVDDTVAEVRETDEWTYKSISRKDTTMVDTSSESREMVLYVAPNGKVVDMEFGKEMSESSIAYFKQYYEQGFPVFPSGAHSQGYTWTQSTKVLLDDEPVEASTTYEITSFAREQGYDCVVISYDGKLIIPIKPNPTDSTRRSGVNRIDITGVMYFAHKEGLTVSNRDRWVIDGERTEVRDGKTRQYKIVYEGDSNLNLKERTKVDVNE